MGGLLACFLIPLMMTTRLISPTLARFSQYKMKTPTAGQEQRRARMLEHQKSKRDDLVSYCQTTSDICN